MLVSTQKAAEVAASAQAHQLLSQFAFVADDWPGLEPVVAAEEVLSGLSEDQTLVVGQDAGGWQWLMGLAPLEFDSHLFAVPMARLAPLAHKEPWPGPQALDQGQQVLAHLLAEAEKAGLEFISARTFCRDFLSAQVLEAAGFCMMDASVEWMVDLGGLPGRKPLPAEMAIRPWQPEDQGPLMELAATAMCELEAYSDRFAMDPRLRMQCRQMYRRWMENSLGGDQADQAMVLTQQDEPQGFLTLKLPPSGQGHRSVCGQVVINAIAPALRGRGLYHQLLQRGLGWLAKHGAAQARVRTKLSQQAVIRTFAKLGGRQVHADYTFHLWLDQIRE